MRSRHLRRAVPAFVLLVLGLLAVPAFAHAELVRTDPAAGAEVDRAPNAVSATFNQPVRLVPGGLRVFDSTGSVVASGAGRHGGGDQARAELEVPALRDGTYAFTWRVVSADGHPVSGGVTFHVGPPQGVEKTLLADLLARQRGSRLVTALAVGADYLGYVAGSLLAGALVGTAWLGLPTRRRLLTGSAAALVVAALGGIVVAVPYALGTPLSTVVGEPSLLADGLRTREGVLGLVQAGLAATVLAGVLRRVPLARVLAALAVGALAVEALSGHSAAGSAAAAWMAVDAVHVAAAGCWAGGLVLLGLTLRQGETAALPRFSRWAMAAVVALVGTGTAQSLREVGGWGALPGTTYGRVLLVKLGLVAAMLAAAAVSRTYLRRTRQVLRSVVVEAALGALVLAVTTVLVGTPPGRDVYDQPVVATAIDFEKEIAVRVTADPARRGRVQMRFVVHRHHGTHDHENPHPLAVRSLTVRMSLPARDIGPIPVALRAAEPGVYLADDVDVPVAGEWQLEASVLVTEVDQVTVLTPLTFH